MIKSFRSRVDKRTYWQSKRYAENTSYRMMKLLGKSYKYFTHPPKSGYHVLDIESDKNSFSYQHLKGGFKPGELMIFTVPSFDSESKIDLVYNKPRPNHDFRIVDTLFNIQNNESLTHKKSQTHISPARVGSGLNMDADHIHIPFTNIYGF